MIEPEPILRVENVSRSFGGLQAVSSASIHVRPASLTALIGPNGAGKSTLFNIISGFDRADSGEVYFGERLLHRMPPHRIARLGLVRTFQLTRTYAALSVLDNLMVSAVGHPGDRLANSLFRRRRVAKHEDQLRTRASELMEALGLSDESRSFAGNLSGGQRKLLELGRALMMNPAVLLLDEPMAGVNRTLGRRLFELVQSIRAERGMTVVFVEHDMDVVMDEADSVVVMAEGRILVEGPPDAVRTNPLVLDAYFGRALHVPRTQDPRT